MAEGGKWSRSFLDSYSKASGDADESFCDPCKSEDNYIAAGGYCQTCGEYLCDNCLQVHRKQKISKSHAVLDKNQMPSGQVSTSDQDLCVDVCKTHHPEIVRFYCKAHDEPGCGDCMTLNHTSCKKDRVQDISGSFNKTNEFGDIKQQLKQLHQELEKLGTELDNDLKNIDTTYNQVRQKIASVRKQINDYLDQMQKKVTDEAAQMQKEDNTELKTLQAENQAIKAEIEAMLKTLHDSNVNVNTLFVTSKQAKHRLVTMKTEINKIKQQQQQQLQYELHISNEIQNIFSAKTTLGTLSRRSSQKSRDKTPLGTLSRRSSQKSRDKTPLGTLSRTSSQKSRDKTPQGTLSRRSSQKSRGITNKQDQKTQRTPTIDTTATYNRNINVKGWTDKENCRISDCKLLGTNRMVVNDWINKNVKLIDISNNRVISSYSTLCAPCGVTALSTNMIAVTLPVEGKIQVLNVTTTFTLQREIKVNKNCWGIAYKDGKFAVSYVMPGRVEILDIQGKILHTIQAQQGEELILQCPQYIIFGQDNDTVIVSDWNTNKVSVVSFKGQILRTYTHDRLISPPGIVMTADGVLYVCSCVGECIHVVSPDFKTSRIIINKDNCVMHPMSITYCDINHTLYISNTSSGHLNNQIQVYDLTV